MDEEACKLWVRKIWQNRPGGLHRRKSLLVWDKFSAHLTDGVTKAVRATNTDISVIPGGLTGILQPLDVSLNKPFKDGMRERWTKWMAAENYTVTPGGNKKSPSSSHYGTMGARFMAWCKRSRYCKKLQKVLHLKCHG